MPLRAGAARVNITPPIGCPLAGFAARVHGATGIRDELWARALYLNNGERELVLVSAEILGFSREIVQRIRRRVETEVGIPGEYVLLSATHTHAGPSMHERNDPTGIAARHRASVEDKLVGLISWAKSQAVPVEIRTARADVRCGANRREWRDGEVVLGVNPDGPVYHVVDLFGTRRQDGSVQSVWFCHPCHPLVLGQDNYLITGDFVGAAANFVERQTGGIGLFANGFAGNITSIPDRNGQPADIDRVGRQLGAAVVQRVCEWGGPFEERPVPFFALEHHFTLPLESVPSVAEAQAQIKEAEGQLEAALAAGNQLRIVRSRQALSAAKERLALAEAGVQPEGAPMTLQALVIGDLALLAAPGEIFIELQAPIREASPFANTICVGYSNGSVGYLPTAEAFAEGGYEVRSCIRHRGLAIAPQSAEVFVREAISLLNKASAALDQAGLG
ncbi:MAG TPA: neutral/alkaline non-lysosomal ceramidase N-terminal domain-containing protein [Limnochordia bacterium]